VNARLALPSWRADLGSERVHAGDRSVSHARRSGSSPAVPLKLTAAGVDDHPPVTD
jgi:hypothetical protein